MISGSVESLASGADCAWAALPPAKTASTANCTGEAHCLRNLRLGNPIRSDDFGECGVACIRRGLRLGCLATGKNREYGQLHRRSPLPAKLANGKSHPI